MATAQLAIKLGKLFSLSGVGLYGITRTKAGDRNMSWVCCKCNSMNELTDVCEYCHHQRCVDCTDEEEEDS
jgi:hypothetical protein